MAVEVFEVFVAFGAVAGGEAFSERVEVDWVVGLLHAVQLQVDVFFGVGRFNRCERVAPDIQIPWVLVYSASPCGGGSLRVRTLGACGLSVRLVGMAKKSRAPKKSQKTQKTQKNRIDDTESTPVQGAAAGVYPISTGEAELVPDGYHADGWLLLINGVQSSHVIVGEPRQLDFEYMRWIAAVVSSHVEEHLDAAKLRITHLGGGACSMARYFADLYPTSRNTVVELDAKLAEYVRAWFDIPKAPRVKIRVGEAGAVTATFAPASRDVLIRDVFAGDTTPEALTTVEFTRTVAESLAPGTVHPQLR